jgi:hypothetical protein
MAEGEALGAMQRDDLGRCLDGTRLGPDDARRFGKGDEARAMKRGLFALVILAALGGAATAQNYPA